MGKCGLAPRVWWEPDPQAKEMKAIFDDPLLSGEYETDDRGRITLGSEYANEKLRVAVERAEDNDN